MNAIEKIKHSLGIKEDVAELVVVVSCFNDVAEAHGNSGMVIRLSGSWTVGTKLLVKSGIVQSVVVDSGLVVYED